jgi:hypothetical protein
MAATLFTALDAVAVSTVGTAVHLGRPMPLHSMQVHHTGSPTITVGLEGSLDGTNFDELTLWDSAVQSNHDIVTASAFAGTDIRAYPVVAWVRANLTLSGGTNPTVTVQIASFGS